MAPNSQKNKKNKKNNKSEESPFEVANYYLRKSDKCLNCPKPSQESHDYYHCLTCHTNIKVPNKKSRKTTNSRHTTRVKVT